MRSGVLVVVLAGCGRVAFEPIGGDGGGAAGADASMLVCPPIAQCPDQTAPVSRGGMSTISRSVTTDHGLSTKTCGSGNANPELAVLLNPITDGTYTVHVTPAVSAVYVQDTCCGGAELVCGQNPLTLDRKAGQRFVVVVESTLSASVTVQVTGN